MRGRRGLPGQLGVTGVAVRGVPLPPLLFIHDCLRSTPSHNACNPPDVPLSLPPNPTSPAEADYFYVPVNVGCLFDVYGWNEIPRWPRGLLGEPACG